MNNIGLALLVVRLNRLFQATRGLSRSEKSAANELAFLISAGLTGIRTNARVSPIGPVTAEDARVLIGGLVEILEAAGVSRPDVASLFNSFLRGHPASQPRAVDPDIRNSWTDLRNEAREGAAGVGVV